MAEPTSILVPAVAAGGAGVVMGLPAPEVILCAVLGAGIAAYMEHAPAYEASRRWAMAVIGSALLGLVVGVVAPSIVTAAAAYYEPVAWLGRLPQWVTALCFATGSRGVIVLLTNRLEALRGKGQGGAPDNQ